MQGFDSLTLDTDMQLGGTDQTFNMQAGRTLIKELKHKESFILATEFLMGTDGRKMSKTWGNAIWLDDKPQDMFAKVMAINDGLIMDFVTLATNWPIREKVMEFEYRLKSENPINIKKDLAFEIVKELNNEKDAIEARENFEDVIQNKKIPKDIPFIECFEGEKPINIIDFLTRKGIAESKSAAKQLLKQNGIFHNNSTVNEPEINIKNDDIIGIGRKSWKLKLKVKR